ncbi:MAG TPA: hypothetical protein VKN99_15610 [Polyangia bacterium]|nr:hypothetical protein [Polyangia bacterium]
MQLVYRCVRCRGLFGFLKAHKPNHPSMVECPCGARVAQLEPLELEPFGVGYEALPGPLAVTHLLGDGFDTLAHD